MLIVVPACRSQNRQHAQKWSHHHAGSQCCCYASWTEMKEKQYADIKPCHGTTKKGRRKPTNKLCTPTPTAAVFLTAFTGMYFLLPHVKTAAQMGTDGLFRKQRASQMHFRHAKMHEVAAKGNDAVVLIHAYKCTYSKCLAWQVI